ncbi:carbohydrate-binding protein [Halovenus marina]|uniref:carbohydrate-binding protein n=1 Tax=Halovenus marina TaxID=3396621 RepID=UPI003F577B06
MDEDITPTRRTVLKSSAAAAAAVTGVTGLTGTTAAATGGIYSPYVGTWGPGVDNAISRDVDHVVFGPAGDATDDGEVNPAWLSQCKGGCSEQPLDRHLPDVQRMQDNGISVGLMVGGYQGRVIARDADSVSELKQGYETVLDTLGISHIDIDDENADDWSRPENLNMLRAKALSQLQDERPDLTVGYTVAADARGMNSNTGTHSPGEHWIEEIAETDLELDYVQLMVMHLGSDPTKQTFESAVDSTAEFISSQYPGKSMDEIYGMIGVVPRYVELSQSSAEGLLELAEEKGLYSIAPWRLGEEDGQYTKIFSQYSGGGSNPDPDPDPDPGNPSADLMVSPSDPSPGEQVTFDASGSSSPNGAIVEYQWDFDNGTTRTTQSATTTQSYDSGSYSPRVTVVDEAERTASASVSLSVSDGGGGGDCDAPAWDSSEVYRSGDRASYDGSVWEVSWWSRGDEPGSSQWGPWEEVGSCDGGDGGDDGDGNCSETDAWDSGATYTGGDRAVYNGAVWEASWWTQGDEPGSSGQWGPWEKIGDC